GTFRSENDKGASAISGALFPSDEPAALHPGELVGEPTLLPAQRLTELIGPQPVAGCLAELHEHLVLRQGEPGVALQLPAKADREQRAHPEIGAPCPLLVRGQPLAA